MKTSRFVLGALGLATRHLPVRWVKRIPGAAWIYTRVYRSIKPTGVVRVETQGGEMYLHAEDEGIARPLLTTGVYEKEETDLFAGLIRPGSVVLDIGANIGYFTLLAAKQLQGSGRVYAFEPEPRNFGLLVRNIALNSCPTVEARQLALSNHNGKLRLFTDATNLGNPSLCAGNVPGAGESVEVEAVTLDEFLARSGELPKVDLIKMDVQGAEGLVLEGARELLRRDRPRILMEFWPAGLKNVGTDPLQLLRGLSGQGYGMTVVGDGRSRSRLSPEEILGLCERKELGEPFVNLFLETIA